MTICLADGGTICQNYIDPQPEICDAVDNDCDGFTDNEVSGNPHLLSRPCHTSLDEWNTSATTPATEGTGPCHSGLSACEQGSWSTTCFGEVGPSNESCNGIDDDCDGLVDDHIPVTFCYEFPDGGMPDPATANVAPCHPGTLACMVGHQVCENEVVPTPQHQCLASQASCMEYGVFNWRVDWIDPTQLLLNLTTDTTSVDYALQTPLTDYDPENPLSMISLVMTPQNYGITWRPNVPRSILLFTEEPPEQGGVLYTLAEEANMDDVGVYVWWAGSSEDGANLIGWPMLASLLKRGGLYPLNETAAQFQVDLNDITSGISGDMDVMIILTADPATDTLISQHIDGLESWVSSGICP